MRTFPRAFTLLEIVITIGIITVLMAILLPAIEHVRHQAFVVKCASNLRQIDIAVSIYENSNRGYFPRTIYDPATASAPVKGTGVSAVDPFVDGTTVQPNDLTAGLFLLMKSQNLPPAIFICPYNDATSFVADSSNFAGRSNFTDQLANLGYSFANPYPCVAAASTGYVLSNKLSGSFPIGADKNPGRGEGNDDVYGAKLGSDTSAMERANSLNHEQEGQNVLFGDGHVSYNRNPFVGLGGDNIYTAKGAVPPMVEQSPTDATDSLLLPTDDR